MSIMTRNSPGPSPHDLWILFSYLFRSNRSKLVSSQLRHVHSPLLADLVYVTPRKLPTYANKLRVPAHFKNASPGELGPFPSALA